MIRCVGLQRHRDHTCPSVLPVAHAPDTLLAREKDALLMASLDKVQLPQHPQGTVPHKGNEVTRQELGAAGNPIQTTSLY